MDEMAAPLVGRGWAVLQPNLYRRSGPFAPFDFATVWTDPAERARIGALMNGFTPEQAMADTRALLGALAADPRWSTRRIAALGYCMGGRMAFYAASAFGDQLVAAASVHGGGLVTPAPNSPHLRASAIRGSLYFAVADQDRSCTPADCEVLRAALDAAGVRHELESFPGKLHGFAMRDFLVYDAEAADRQWSRILAQFSEAFAAA
jgi:carboxymethylenebutenolidase